MPNEFIARKGLIVSGSTISTGGFTGSLAGSSSFATTASYALSSAGVMTNAISASIATTASYALSSAGVITNAISASFATNAATASLLLGSVQSASFATTASAATSITFVPTTASFSTTSSAATSITFTPSTASFATTSSAATSLTFIPSTASFASTASGLTGGTANYIPLWTSATQQSSSILFQTGSNVGVGTTNAPYRLTVFPLIDSGGATTVSISNNTNILTFTSPVSLNAGDVVVATTSNTRFVIPTAATSASFTLTQWASTGITSESFTVERPNIVGLNGLNQVRISENSAVGSITIGPPGFGGITGGMTLVSTGTSGIDSSRDIRVIRYSDNTSGPFIGVYKARGTFDNPAAVQNGDQLGQITFNGWAQNTTNGRWGTNTNASIIASANNAPVANGGIPTRLTINLQDPNGTLTERMRINTSGSVGIGTASPQATLHVGGTISSSGVVTIPAGTATAPSLTSANNSNVGIFFPATDTIAFTKGGTESMRIDSLGNVGIGTTLPGATLHIQGNVSASSFTGSFSGSLTGLAASASFATTASAATSLTFIPSTASFASTASGLTGGTTNYIPVWSSGTQQSSSAIFQSSGNIGIGTITPNGKLTITGTVTGSLLVNTNVATDNSQVYSMILGMPNTPYVGGGFMISSNQAADGGKAFLSVVNYNTTNGTNIKPAAYIYTFTGTSHETRQNPSGNLSAVLDVSANNLTLTNENLYIRHSNFNSTTGDYVNSQAYLYMVSSSTTTNVNSYVGYFSRGQFAAGTPTITTFADFNAGPFVAQSSGRITTRYGLLIDFPATGITNPYGVFQSQTGIINYFAGNVGVGTASPLYRAHVVGTSGTVGLGLGGTHAAGDIGLLINPSAITGSYTAISGQPAATTGVLYQFGNGDSANSTADTRVNVQVGGASAGDPKTTYTISGVLNWSVGVDNSDGDRFKISASDSPGTSDVLTLDSSGNLGLGVTPTYQIDVSRAGDTTLRLAARNTGGGGNDVRTFVQSFFRDANAGIGNVGFNARVSDFAAALTRDDTSKAAWAITGGYSNSTFENQSYLAFRYVTAAGTTVERWRMDSSGHLLAGADATYDIGASGATRPRDLFLSRTATVQSLVETSTQVLKKDITPIETTLPTLSKLSPSRFKWIDTDEPDIGLVAEQVEPLFPDLVKRDSAGNISGVKYSKLTVLLLKAIQEMSERIEILEQKPIYNK